MNTLYSVDKRDELKTYGPVWEMIRDFKEGERVVKAKGKKYLPPINKTMDIDKYEYDSYKSKGKVKNVTSKAISARAGMILHKDPQVPEDKTNIIHEDMTGTGVNVDEFITNIVDEVCTTQFCGIFVDYSIPSDVEMSGRELSLAEAEKLGKRAYSYVYPAESIVNFDVDEDGKIRFVLLREEYNDYEQTDIDKLSPIRKDQYRLLMLREGIYYNEVYRETDTDTWEPSTSMTPKMNGQNLNYLPFVFVNGVDNTPKIYKPKSEDIANMAKHDYIDNTDYKHILKMVCRPTPWIAGTTDDKAVYQLGPGNVWKFPETDAKVGMLEVSGAGIQNIEKNLETNVEEMSGEVLDSMGIQKPNETATHERYERQGQTVSLKTNAKSIQNAINRTRWIMYEWHGIKYIPQDDDIKLNTDYIFSMLSAQEMTATIQAYLQNTITLEDVFHIFQRGGRIRYDKNYEDHENEIVANGGQIDQFNIEEED